MKRIFLVLVVFLVVSLAISCMLFYPNSVAVPSLSVSKSGKMVTYATKSPNPSKNGYHINSVKQLYTFAEQVNKGKDFTGITVYLDNDLIINNDDKWDSWDENTKRLDRWTPIGTEANPFKGKFDGQGYNIRGLFVVEHELDGGLFGRVHNALIVNTNVIHGFVRGGESAGALCGTAINSIIRNCNSKVSVVGWGKVGGLIGEFYCNENREISLIGCKNFGSVLNERKFTSSDYYYSVYATGGVVGSYALRERGISSKISACYNYGKVTGDSCVGGVIGKSFVYYRQVQSIDNCFNGGEITSSDKRVGGIVGYNYGDAGGYSDGRVTITVKNCVNSGNIHGNGSNIGGIVGFSHLCTRNQMSCEIFNSINLADGGLLISGDYDRRYANRITVRNCYNTGEERKSLESVVSTFDTSLWQVSEENITPIAGTIS